jgi:hypothetical protein
MSVGLIVTFVLFLTIGISLVFWGFFDKHHY